MNTIRLSVNAKRKLIMAFKQTKQKIFVIVLITVITLVTAASYIFTEGVKERAIVVFFGIYLSFIVVIFLRISTLGVSIDPNRWVEPTPKTFPGTRWIDVIAYWKWSLYIFMLIGTFVVGLWHEGTLPPRSTHDWFVIIFWVLIMIVLAFILIATIYNAIRKTCDYVKYGRIPFHMKLCPASVGGSVEGVLELPTRATDLHQVSIKLVCVKSSMEIAGSGKSKRIKNIRVTDVWSYQDIVTVYWDGMKRTAAINIKIPAGLPVAHTIEGRQNIKHNQDSYYWVLKVHTKTDEVNIEREFKIPMQINRASENQ